jgi:hypothetical protein
MSDFQKDDRVVVIRGEHSGKHGKVIGQTIYGFWENRYPIKLDDHSNLDLPIAFLEHESLKTAEIAAEVKNIKNQVDRVTSQLPGEMGTELPTHVRLLGEAIASRDKLVSTYEYNYVTNNLEKATESGAVTPEWREDIRISLEKINWAVKRLQ